MAKNNIKSIFGKALKDLRESRGLTQEQLAEQLELQAYQTISLIENGKSFVTSELLEKMCALFNVSPEYFFMLNQKPIEKERAEYIKEIKTLLPTLPVNRLKDIYNIIQCFYN